MPYYFYVLYSQKLDRYYIGHTSDVEGRLRRHNSRHKGFTAKTDDWMEVYREPYATKEEAYRRELEVKKWKSRRRVQELSSAG